jgi:prepilin-type N-terminal cleavage/methylation domain-containing protein|tara:strand:- start:47 stop:451 length:405 start_codon:yes stop_codon:yes gene_type:complete
MKRKIKGFSLMELMIVILLIGILSAVGIIFFGTTVEQARKEAAKASTSSIYLVQQEYMSNNSSYYYTSGGCSSTTTGQIISELFDGSKDLSEKDFYYCISGNSNSNTFKITAKNKTTNCQIMRDEKNNVTESNC